LVVKVVCTWYYEYGYNTTNAAIRDIDWLRYVTGISTACLLAEICRSKHFRVRYAQVTTGISGKQYNKWYSWYSTSSIMDIDTSMHIIKHKRLQLIELLRTVFGLRHVQVVFFSGGFGSLFWYRYCWKFFWGALTTWLGAGQQKERGWWENLGHYWNKRSSQIKSLFWGVRGEGFQQIFTFQLWGCFLPFFYRISRMVKGCLSRLQVRYGDYLDLERKS